MVGILAPYTRTFNFDPNFTRYHLTAGSPQDDDHFIEVTSTDSPDEILARFPNNSWPGSQRHERFQSLATVISNFARQEADNVTGQLAMAIGARVMRNTGHERVIVRCRAHRAQPRDLGQQVDSDPEDPSDEQYFEDIYEADVWTADDGSIQVVKRSERRQVAPLREGDSQ